MVKSHHVPARAGERVVRVLRPRSVRFDRGITRWFAATSTDPHHVHLPPYACRADAPPYASTAQPARAVVRRRRDYLPPERGMCRCLLCVRTCYIYTNSPWPRSAPTARVSTYTVPRPLEPPAAGVVMALCSRRPARRTVRSDMHRLDILSIGPGAGVSATERMVGAGAAVPT